MEYGGFEGVIPKGNYGAGSVMLWDRGTYELLGEATAEEQLARGDFKFHLTGEKLSGDFAIVRIKTRQRATSGCCSRKKTPSPSRAGTPRIMPAACRPAAPRKRSPASCRPLDAPARTTAICRRIFRRCWRRSAKGTPPSSDDWLFEIKWDGVRAICLHRQRPLASGFAQRPLHRPPVSRAFHSAASHQGENGDSRWRNRRARRPRPSQLRASPAPHHRGEASAIATLARKTRSYFSPSIFYISTAATCAAFRSSSESACSRKSLEPGDLVRYSDHFAGNGPELFAAAKAQGLEGIVGKRAQSFYESRRTSDWVKWKVTESGSNLCSADSPKASATCSARWCWAFTIAAN